MAEPDLEKAKQDLLKIFDESQRVKNSKKCLKDFVKLYKQWQFPKQNAEKFVYIIVQIMKSILASDRSSFYTKRSLEFLTTVFKTIETFEEEAETKRLEKVAAELASKQKDASVDSEEEEMDELGRDAFDPDQTIIDARFLSLPNSVDLIITDILLKFLKAENVNVRSNTASLLRRILENSEELEESTFTELKKNLSSATFDRDRVVRSFAVLALNKLQDAWDQNDVALKALNFHIVYDPDLSVRTCALKTLEVTSESLKQILKATKDINKIVRKTALSKIAERCEIFHFTIEDRYFILRNGIRDGSHEVRDTVLKSLIPAWIKRLDNSIEKFLEYLDIKHDLEFYDCLLRAYFATLYEKKKDTSPFHRVVFDFKDKYLDSYKLFTKMRLSEENIFLWFELCAFCVKNNVVYEKIVENEDEETPEEKVIIDLIDDIIPDIPIYCDYITGFISKVLESDKSSQNVEEKNFIFIQLIKIAQLFQIKDTASWDVTFRTFKNIILLDELYNVFKDYIEEIMIVFANYFKEDEAAFLNLVFDLINSLNHPELAGGGGGDSQQLTATSEIQVPTSEISVATQNERMDSEPIVLERCIVICYCYLHIGNPKKPNALLPTLINRIVIPNIVNKDSEQIRLFSIKALGNYCFASSDTVNHFLKVFVEVCGLVDVQLFSPFLHQIIEEKNYFGARVEALKFLFDFVGYHGTRKIRFIQNDYKESDTNLSKNYFLQKSHSTMDLTDRWEDFIDYFSELMLSFLNEPTLSLERINSDFKLKVEYDLFETCVKGLCKILYLGRLYSGDFFARLIVIYTAYENVDESLRHYIKGFLYSYAQEIPKYKAFFTTENPFVDAYINCFKQLMERSENRKDARVYETINNIFMIFVEQPELKNTLVMQAIEILDLSTDKELIVITLRFISKMISYNELKFEESKEMRSLLERFLQRYKREFKLARKNDRNVDSINKLITALEIVISRLESKQPATGQLTSSANEEKDDTEMEPNDDELDNTIIDED